MATIATHNGSQVSRKHNIRDFDVVSKEPHIDLSRPHEIWIDRDIKAVYRDIFGEAAKEFNQRQKNKDRIIKDYYSKIEADPKKHVCYEMIIGVYDKLTPTATKREILKEFVGDWQQRNPNLYLIGAYYHADEQGQNGPHVHIDYIPVARNLTRGMRVQNALNKALEQQGYKSNDIHNTAQIQWEHSENDYLEQLCKKRGITVEHDTVKRDHLQTGELKIIKQHMGKAQQVIDELAHPVAMPKGQRLPGGKIIVNEHDIEQLVDDYNALSTAQITIDALQEYTDVKSVRALQIDAEMYKQLHERSDAMYLREHDKVIKLTDELEQSERLNDWYELRDKLANGKSDVKVDKNYIAVAKEHDLD